MEIVDNKTGVPQAMYRRRFAAMDPQAMSDKSGVSYADGVFSMTLMGRPMQVSWPQMEVIYADTGEKARGSVQILLPRLIMEGSIVPSTGKMLAYTEMPWGEVYGAQFKGRCIMRLAGSFGNTPEKFAFACKALGGTPAKGGDAAFDIPFLPGLIVRLMIWEGDDEFAPASQILFSDNFPAAFSAEDIAVVGDVLIDAMKGRW